MLVLVSQRHEAPGGKGQQDESRGSPRALLKEPWPAGSLPAGGHGTGGTCPRSPPSLQRNRGQVACLHPVLSVMHGVQVSIRYQPVDATRLRLLPLVWGLWGADVSTTSPMLQARRQPIRCCADAMKCLPVIQRIRQGGLTLTTLPTAPQRAGAAMCHLCPSSTHKHPLLSSSRTPRSRRSGCGFSVLIISCTSLSPSSCSGDGGSIES